jgi:hypothetical protein
MQASAAAIAGLARYVVRISLTDARISSFDGHIEMSPRLSRTG